MKKKILVIQHVPHEDLGTIGPAARGAGFAFDYIRVFRPGGLESRVPRTLEGYSALVVLGGPMGAYEEDRYPSITDELRLISSALADGVPTLGICLGSQLMARAAGARVYKGDKKEIGWYPVRLTCAGTTDPLFAGLPEEMTVFQWHGDTFDIPPGARNLAGSPLFPNQVLRLGAKAYGIQFHFEVTGEMIRSWIDENAGELAGVRDYIDPSAIIEQAPEGLAELHRYGETVTRRFLRLINT